MITAQPNWIDRLWTLGRAYGAYVAIEVLLPGGSLIALTLWIFRNRERVAARVRRAVTRIAALGASVIRAKAHFPALGNLSAT